MDMREYFIDKIGFLKWAKLHPEDIQEMVEVENFIVCAYVSPDVHSLHMVWEESDGSTRIEREDYPYDDEFDSPKDWLCDELGFDSLDTIYGTSAANVLDGSLYYKQGSTPTIRLD